MFQRYVLVVVQRVHRHLFFFAASRTLCTFDATCKYLHFIEVAFADEIQKFTVGTMIETRTYHGQSLDIARSGSERVCYIILPEGLKDEGRTWMEKASREYVINLVAMSGMDWNNALTPWSAEGVFRKAKPFAGNAELFLNELRDDFIPSIEASLGIRHPERYLAGVSLSGLFAVWSVFRCQLFRGVASVSGSLWFDGFPEWASLQSVSPSVERMYISLGDREKLSKDRRLASVEEMTLNVVEILRAKGVPVEFRLEPGITHFSPIVPRLERALCALLGVQGE